MCQTVGISLAVSSCRRSVAIDCVLYRKIKSENDVAELQKGLDHIHTWCSECKISLNPPKNVYNYVLGRKKNLENHCHIDNNQVRKQPT